VFRRGAMIVEHGLRDVTQERFLAVYSILESVDDPKDGTRRRVARKKFFFSFPFENSHGWVAMYFYISRSYGGYFGELASCHWLKLSGMHSSMKVDWKSGETG
jgi:hypothetical protein